MVPTRACRRRGSSPRGPGRDLAHRGCLLRSNSGAANRDYKRCRFELSNLASSELFRPQCRYDPGRNGSRPGAMIAGSRDLPMPVEKRAMKAVILAGGEGTRLRPLTLSAPKPVVPVVDRPLLRHQLDLLATAGIREVVFSLAYRPERIQAVFGDGSALGMQDPLRRRGLAPGHGRGGQERRAASSTTAPSSSTATCSPTSTCPRSWPPTRAREPRATHRAHARLQPRRLRSGRDRSRYGRVRRFIEKPKPAEITTDTINAGDLRAGDARRSSSCPPASRHSIERALLPRPPRPRRPRARPRPPRVLDRHRHAREVPARSIATSSPAASPSPSTARRKAAAGCTARPGSRTGSSSPPPFYVGPGCRVEAGARIGAGLGPGGAGARGPGCSHRRLRPLGRLRSWPGQLGGGRAPGPGRARGTQCSRQGRRAGRGVGGQRLLADRLGMRSRRGGTPP